MKLIQLVLLVSTIIFTIGCNSEKKEGNISKEKSTNTDSVDASEPVESESLNQDWIDVQSKVSRMNNETTYAQIIELLGKPYQEYASPTVPEEYLLFYNVPGVNGAIFWVTIQTQTKTFLYWSGEKNEK